jgi:hypothetical protein
MGIKLVDNRNVIKVKLPSFPGSEVEMYEHLLAGDQMNMVEKAQDESDLKTMASFKMVVKCIKSWNFVDDDEKPLEISVENLQKLPTVDFFKLLEIPSQSKLVDENNKIIMTAQKDKKK